jgi:hypothetical protein
MKIQSDNYILKYDKKIYSRYLHVFCDQQTDDEELMHTTFLFNQTQEVFQIR